MRTRQLNTLQATTNIQNASIGKILNDHCVNNDYNDSNENNENKDNNDNNDNHDNHDNHDNNLKPTPNTK